MTYGDCTYGGGTYGNLCGAAPGGGWLHRGPYRVRVEGTVEIQLDDDELVILLSSGA